MTLNHAISQNRGCFSFASWALLLFSVLFVGRFVMDLRLAAFGKTTDGVVIKVTERHSINSRARTVRVSDASSGGGVSYDLTVRFTPESATPVEFETSSTFGHELKEGDTVKVIYLSSDLMGAEIYSAKQLWLPLCVGFIVSSACLGGGYFLRQALAASKAEQI